MGDLNCNTRRRWFQFGLRSILVLTLVIAAYFAGWRSALWKAERDKEEATRKAVEDYRAKMEIVGQYIPELDMIVTTGPSENTEKVQKRLRQLEQLFGRQR